MGCDFDEEGSLGWVYVLNTSPTPSSSCPWWLQALRWHVCWPTSSWSIGFWRFFEYTETFNLGPRRGHLMGLQPNRKDGLSTFTCGICEQPFQRRACYVNRSIRNGVKFIACSRSCVNRYYKKLATGSKNPAWKGGITKAEHRCLTCSKVFLAGPRKKYCSTSCYGRAISLWNDKPKEPNTRNHHKYRRIAEALLGRTLLKNEVVHHIDGNYLNNDPENLQVMTKSEHTQLHVREQIALRKQMEKEKNAV